MTLWRWSWLAVCHVADLDAAEARNVAAKLPALLGDVGAVVFVLVTGRRSPRRALWLAALLWALPVSWVNGAVLGYVDSAYEPVMAAGLWAAGLGRAGTSGALLAMAALIKPTALLAAPAAAVALAAVGAPLVRALLAGAAITAATLVPFAVAGTGPAAVAHVSRILSQRQLSGGFANAWWIVGHTVVSWGHGAPAWRSPVTHVPIDAVGVPAAAVGVMLFALSAAFVLRAQRRAPGPQPAALGAAALVLSYGICAIGVHENHPHAVFLLLLATGLPGRRLRLIFAGLAVTYTLGLVALGGLGRFYGPRYMATSGWSAAVRALRLLPGFDLTLVLAVANLALFVWLLWSLRSLLSLCARDVPPPVMPRPQRRKSTAI
jgi:hypothetical protein